MLNCCRLKRLHISHLFDSLTEVIITMPLCVTCICVWICWFRMETKHRKWQQAVCPFSGEKLTDNMTVDEMARSLRVSVLFMVVCCIFSCNMHI